MTITLTQDEIHHACAIYATAFTQMEVAPEDIRLVLDTTGKATAFCEVDKKTKEELLRQARLESERRQRKITNKSI